MLLIKNWSLNDFDCVRKDRQTDGQTGTKNYTPMVAGQSNKLWSMELRIQEAEAEDGSFNI